MPGLAVDLVDNDTGYVSSSTSTLAGYDSTADELDNLSTMAISATATANQPPLKKPSLRKANTRLPSPHISSPTSLPQFPIDNNFSPFCSPPVLLQVGGPQSPSCEKEPVSFFVHSEFLTRASGFFRSALSSYSSKSSSLGGLASYSSYSFLEAQTRTIDLPEDRPDDVRFFLRWLYHGFGMGVFAPECSNSSNSNSNPTSATPNTETPASTDPNPCPTTLLTTPLQPSFLLSPQTTHLLCLHRTYNSERALLLPKLKKHHHSNTEELHNAMAPLLPPRPPPPAFGPLIRLYILADKYEVGLGLKDWVVETVREMAATGNTVPGAGDVGLLWEGLPRSTGSVVGERGGSRVRGLKKLVVDLYVGMNTLELLAQARDEGDEWDEGFMRDLMVEMKRNGLEGRMRGENAVREEWMGRRMGMVKVGILWRERCGYHDHRL